ncbi:MAG: hypothetical protein L6R40_000829 [Gallowayella cf. fulva]|nr:MAG: hypothetical protein L6R40_000829 [Xanthomendoza cf. fulva]
MDRDFTPFEREMYEEDMRNIFPGRMDRGAGGRRGGHPPRGPLGRQHRDPHGRGPPRRGHGPSRYEESEYTSDGQTDDYSSSDFSDSFYRLDDDLSYSEYSDEDDYPAASAPPGRRRVGILSTIMLGMVRVSDKGMVHREEFMVHREEVVVMDADVERKSIRIVDIMEGVDIEIDGDDGLFDGVTGNLQDG